LTCGFRIGNKIYEQKNKSYGITTLNYSHIKLFVEKGSNCVLFDFVGKKGVRNTAICKNKHIYDYLSRKVNNAFSATAPTLQSGYYGTRNVIGIDMTGFSGLTQFRYYIVGHGGSGNSNQYIGFSAEL
jgi:hypothetical protein